jgi:Zn-dependent protease with chaperone function
MAERVGTRAVDTVFVTPGTELAVFERGGLRSQLRGQAERCLILGIGVLDGMTIGQFNAVLAHEYGHFSNRDTAGGGFALSVRRSLITMAVHLARGGAAGWYNPAWQFLKAFDAVFMRISQGASRLQEVLADRWAAVTCGSEAFVSGLRHVIEASVRFNARANAVVNEALKQQVPLPNLYRFTTTTPEAAAAESEIPVEVTKALDAEPSEYDSHPTPHQRISWVTSLAIVVEPRAGDADGAWSMFPDREQLERLLTEHVRGNLERTHGVEFATEGVSPNNG